MNAIKNITQAIFKILMIILDNVVDFLVGPMIDMATEENLNYYTTTFGIMIRVIFVMSLIATVPQYLVAISVFWLKLSLAIRIITTVAEVFMALKGVESKTFGSYFDTTKPVNV